MSRLYRYQIEIGYDNPPDPGIQSSLEDGLSPAQGRFDPRGAVFSGDRWLTGGASERQEHDDIVRYVRGFIPTARVTTRWLYLEDCRDWDEEFTTE